MAEVNKSFQYEARDYNKRNVIVMERFQLESKN